MRPRVPAAISNKAPSLTAVISCVPATGCALDRTNDSRYAMETDGGVSSSLASARVGLTASGNLTRTAQQRVHMAAAVTDWRSSTCSEEPANACGHGHGYGAPERDTCCPR